MTFSLFQSSRAKSLPVNLYFFRYGDLPSSYFAYTDAEQSISINQTEFGDPALNPVVYVPVPIDRGDYAFSGTLDKSALSVMIPQTLPLAELFRVYPKSFVVTLVIRELEINDPDKEAKIYWAGRVLGSARADNQAKFTCEPVSTSTRRVGLRRNFQPGCPYVLYGPQCKANKAAATVVDTPTSFDASTLTFSPSWSDVAHGVLYIGGQAIWTGLDGEPVIRSIIDGSANRIFTLAGVTTDLAVGQPVTLIRGCTHDMAGCNSHNNIQNYGGCPFLPVKNPISMFNNFY